MGSSNIVSQHTNERYKHPCRGPEQGVIKSEYLQLIVKPPIHLYGVWVIQTQPQSSQEHQGCPVVVEVSIYRLPTHVPMIQTPPPNPILTRHQIRVFTVDCETTCTPLRSERTKRDIWRGYMKTYVSGPRQVRSLCWDRLWDDIISNNESGWGHINTQIHVGVT